MTYGQHVDDYTLILFPIVKMLNFPHYFVYNLFQRNTQCSNNKILLSDLPAAALILKPCLDVCCSTAPTQYSMLTGTFSGLREFLTCSTSSSHVMQGDDTIINF